MHLSFQSYKGEENYKVGHDMREIKATKILLTAEEKAVCIFH